MQTTRNMKARAAGAAYLLLADLIDLRLIAFSLFQPLEMRAVKRRLRLVSFLGGQLPTDLLVSLKPTRTQIQTSSKSRRGSMTDADGRLRPRRGRVIRPPTLLSVGCATGVLTPDSLANHHRPRLCRANPSSSSSRDED